MRKMMTEQQYQALVARSGAANNISQQLLLAHSQPHSSQYLSRKLYADSAAAAVDPYVPAGSSLAASNGQYPRLSHRTDSYSDSQDLRAQFPAERRALLPSPALIDYPSAAAYVDNVGPRALSGTPMSPEVAGAYASHYISPQRAGQALSNAAMVTPSDLLAAQARRAEIPSSYPGGYGNGVQRLAPASAYDEQGILPSIPGRAASILGPGGPSRSPDLDRYLLAVQPDKLIRYAASCLVPEPALGRRYPVVSNNVNSEDDMYSNYRRAKARRIESYDFRDNFGSRRDRDREPYREREQNRERKRVGDSSRDRGKISPNRRSKNASAGKVHDANRPSNSSQSSGGKRSGGQNKRSRASEQAEQAAEAKKKEGNDPESDKDSELGSLCADLSDSEDEKAKKKSAEATTRVDGSLAGMIFGCSSATFHECMRLQLFGLPAKSKDDVMRVTPGTKVFLFNFDTKELSGIFEAISHGGWQIQPDAFREFGGFPAQVQVCCSEQCPNLTQSVFRPAIKENYVNQNRFRFNLNSKQVKDLVRLFRQAARDRPRQQGNLEHRYLRPLLQSEDYLLSGGQQQRPYSRHPQARFGTSRVSYARVISMSPKTNVRQSKRASKKALKGRKKRKVSNRRESPVADNCSSYSLSGEIKEADVTINASKYCGCDHTSNTNNSVVVREGIETGSPRNVDQQKEIVEKLGKTAAKGMDPSDPDHGLSLSRAEESPQLQSDLGKQVSLVEDSYNDGNFGLAGGRAEEHGQGQGLDVCQGALSTSGNVIKSSDSTLSSMGEGLCPEYVQGVLSSMDPVEPLVKLGGDKIQQVATGTDGYDHLSEPDEKSNVQGLDGIAVPKHDKHNDGLDTDIFESITTDIGTGGNLPGVHMDEVLVESVQDDADCELPCVGKDEELLVTAASGVDSEAPFVGKEVIIIAEAQDNEILAVTEEKGSVEMHDDDVENEEVILAANTIESELPLSGDTVILNGGGEDEEEAIISANAVDCELITSGDEEEEEAMKDCDYGEGEEEDCDYGEDDDEDEEDEEEEEEEAVKDCDYDDGEDEHEEGVEVSVDGEFSNTGEDEDEHEYDDRGQDLDDNPSCDLD